MADGLVPSAAAAAIHISDAVFASNSTDSGQNGSNEAAARLLNTLLAIIAAIFIGFAVVRWKLVKRDQGELKGMAYYNGKIALPLLVFKTVATAEIGNVNLGVIAACTLGKLAVMFVTGLISFVAYGTRRGRGQRVLTSIIFGFFAASSNDFAVGFPVVDALYGATADMTIYLAANAVVGSLLFSPLTLILLSAAQGMMGNEKSAFKGFLIVLRDTLTNPVISCTILGGIYKALLGFTVTPNAKGQLQLPSPLGDVIALLTGPFGMCALFLTGTSLKSAGLSMWPALLVIMNVLVCAFVCMLLGNLFVGVGVPQQHLLLDFTFFYGCIPASTSPLIFANQYDPDSGSSSLVATAVLQSLILAGPIMFMTAVFQQFKDGGDLKPLLRRINFSTSILSVVCGAAFVMLALSLRREWGHRDPAKQVLLGYGIAALAYESAMVIINPKRNPGPCLDYNKNPWSATRILVGWLQNAPRLMLLSLLFMSVQRRALHPRTGGLVILICCLLAVVPALLVDPNTVTEVCSSAVTDPPSTPATYIERDFFWAVIQFTATVGLAVWGRWQTYRALDRQQASNHGAAGHDPAGGDGDGEMVDIDFDVSSRMSVTSTATTIAAWVASPEGVFLMARDLNLLQAVRSLMQVVVTWFIQTGSEASGGFIQMVVLEHILEHIQLCVLLLALLHMEDFTTHFARKFPRLWPWLVQDPSAPDFNADVLGDFGSFNLKAVDSFSMPQSTGQEVDLAVRNGI